MARLATTSDAFNAVAEPQRRRILDLLAQGERSVNDIAGTLRITQPQVSKHLRVLREVGLVSVRGSGQQRLYSLSGGGLQPVHDWVGQFERFWNESFDRLADYLDELQQQEKSHEHPGVHRRLRHPVPAHDWTLLSGSLGDPRSAERR